VAGAVDWSNLTVAGAFALGATLATFATIRVVRAVAATLERDPHRRRRRRRRGGPPSEAEE
jgi:hypothetical protein